MKIKHHSWYFNNFLPTKEYGFIFYLFPSLVVSYGEYANDKGYLDLSIELSWLFWQGYIDVQFYKKGGVR